MIKNNLTFTIIFLSSLISFSQDYKDQIILSAAVGGESSHIYEDNSNTENLFDYNFNVKAGYFITKRSSVGIYVGFSKRKFNHDYSDTLTHEGIDRGFYAGPYYNHYFKLVKKLNFDMFVSANYRYSIQKRSYGTFYPITENSYNLTFIPGFSYEITDKVSVDLDIGEFTAYILNYKRADPTLDKDSQTATTFRTYTSLNNFRLTALVFGFSYKISHK